MASVGYHEQLDLISQDTKDMHRGIVSLMEELEAIDWYQQRADACTDEELKQILIHNKNEEIEHASMVLEWIRRRSAKFDEELRSYLFRAGSITAAEGAITGSAEGDANATPGPSLSLGIGSLKGRE